jgi:MoaA/NifB/PqqE/SkfB family radical SAM enzyme
MTRLPPLPSLTDGAFRTGQTARQTALDESRIARLRDHSRYISVTMEFRCNLRCTHCMIEGTMDRLPPTSDAEFAQILRDQAERRPWDGLILTGSEITLRRDLGDLVRRARNAGFSHIRIQTHGMQLSRPGYLDGLIAAGVDEFFISVAGSDAETHDRITQVPGSWDRMIRGIEQIEAHGGDLVVITNTVVTAQSYTLLSGMVQALARFSCVAQHEFWNYFPMAERDEKNLIVRHADLIPPLRAAIAAAQAAGRRVEVKNVPQCLLGDDSDTLVNAQPTLVISPDFWVEFDRNGFYRCPHQNRCASQECLGLTEAYIHRFGDERDLLKILPKMPDPS